MIDSMVNIRDFELMVSDTDMSKAGKGPMNIEIHLALADELITRLRESERDAARWRMALSKHENDRDGFGMVEFKSSSQFLSFADVTAHIDYEIDRAMKENQCYDDEIMFSGQVIDAIDSAGIIYK